MGYYANGDGAATFKNGVDIEKVGMLLDDKLDELDVIEFEFEIKGNEIYFYDSEKYHEDETLAFLNVLAPYITEGKMTYSGEDDCHWRFVFNSDEQGWDEESGTVDFDFESYTDEDLIVELERRGYNVTK